MASVKVYYHERWNPQDGGFDVIEGLMVTMEKITELSAEVFGNGQEVDESQIIDGWYGDENFRSFRLILTKTEVGYHYEIRESGSDVRRFVTGPHSDPVAARREARHIVLSQNL